MGKCVLIGGDAEQGFRKKMRYLPALGDREGGVLGSCNAT